MDDTTSKTSETPESNTSNAAGPSTAAIAAPVAKLLTRRKAQQQQVAAASTAAGSAAVKVELSDSEDATDKATAAEVAASPITSPASAATAAAVPVASGSSTRRTGNRSETANKRPIIEVDDWSSDEEDFAGFDVQKKSALDAARHRNKKIKEEPLSDHEQVNIKLEVKMEEDNDADDAAAASTSGAHQTRRNTPKRISTPPRSAAAIEPHLISPLAGTSSASVPNVTTPTTGVGAYGINALGIGGSGGGKSTTNIADPRYRKPFTFGWKRELVYRAHNDVHRKQYDKAEVYYITPAGKKLRTRADILTNLTEGLEANDFTFAREPIGMSAEEEIIRSAKLQAPSVKRPANFLDLGEPDPQLGFGKRIPKPKVPKGASPPPGVTAMTQAMLLAKQNASGGRNALNKQMAVELEKSTGKATKSAPKAKGEPCTINCVLAMGTIPQMHCKKCLCLFHPECVVRRPSTGPNNYVCESCLHELNEPSDAVTAVSSAASTSSANSSISSVGGGNGNATVTTAASSAMAAATSAATGNSNKRNIDRIVSPAANNAIITNEAAKGKASSPSTSTGNETATTTITTSSLAGIRSGLSTGTKNAAASSGNNIISTWMPGANAAATNRNETDVKTKRPQSIAIVAGRKYIMVPKANLMSVSPGGGRLDVAIGDNNGCRLRYMDDKGGDGAAPASKHPATMTTPHNDNSSAAAADGSDTVSSPFKKRLLTRTAPGKTPSGSPRTTNSNHNPSETRSSNSNSGASTGSTPSKRVHQKTANASTAPNNNCSNSNSASSVHTLFATNFFDNVSTGYNVLMHTFQYLKVQELLRASCVCRMWNQAAQNSLLWRTVRMKNSQVNDWSGLVSTLKRNGTKHLDLRKMVLPSGSTADEAWLQFSQNIGRHGDLEAIDLCRLPARVVERLFESNTELRVLNAVSIKDEQVHLVGADRMHQLRELRLKSLNSMHIDSLQTLPALRDTLQHLALTSIKQLGTRGISFIGELTQLESLELGECSELTAGFSADVLLKLQRLQRLRLEKGQDKCCTFEIIDAVAKLPQLVQLELVNFDIKPDFDTHLKGCRNVKRLLVIPTYISQSATTNHMILNALLGMAGNLEQLTWGVTLELLRVTELYVDQCKDKRRDRKLSEDKIPVLKPVPGMTGALDGAAGGAPKSTTDVPQVEILPLEKVEKILAQHMPATNLAIIKLPFHATWRQSITDGQ